MLCLKDGLLEELRNAEVLNDRHVSRIESHRDRSVMNEELLEIMRRRSRVQYAKFLQCLRRNGQHQVAHMIEHGIVGGKL